MTLVHAAPPAPAAHPLVVPRLRALAARLLREERALAWAGAIHLALVPLLVALMPLDGRTVLGIDPWIKPMKFAASIGIYLLTVALLLLPLRAGRARSFVRWTALVPLSGEMAIIGLQAARGVRSHFNFASPLDAGLFSLMGLMILATTIGGIVLLVMHLRARSLPPALAWGVRAGIALSLVGAVVGGAMSARGGHAVGAEDGGEGLPVVNWSREHGDLRIAHFAGLHALQALPLAGLVAARRTDARRGVRLVAAVAALYALGVLGTFALALAGRPLP